MEYTKRKYYQLLSINADTKTKKGLKKGYLTGIMYLAPHKISGRNMCSYASKGCISSCLYSAGRGKFNSVETARINKTKYFLNDKTNFMLDLIESIIRLKKKAENKKLTPVIRLNGTSDLLWENIKINNSALYNRKYILDNFNYLNIISFNNIMDLFADVQFYDYTKNPFRVKLPNNYYLTFSRAENNEQNVEIALKRGLNVAVVFNELPKKYYGLDVINADETDLRFLDINNAVVGLIAKGDAKRDTTGFVV